MNEPFHEPLTVWRFIRRHFVRIVIGAVLVVVFYGALLVWVPYQREQRIAKELEVYGGVVKFRYAGPDWIPQSMRDRMTLFSRVTEAHLNMDLDNAPVTDVDLEHLKGLTNLEWLNLNETQVTDAGLKHLKGLTSLKALDVEGTRVTAEGRAMLRKLLPNCRIKPDP